MIMTRDRTKVVDYTEIKNKSFIVQTNQDHFKGDCPIRCQTANQKMQNMKSNMSTDLVVSEVLTQWPNLNLFSIYSTVFVPLTSYSHTYHVRASNLTDPGDII